MLDDYIFPRAEREHFRKACIALLIVIPISCCPIFIGYMIYENGLYLLCGIIVFAILLFVGLFEELLHIPHQYARYRYIAGESIAVSFGRTNRVIDLNEAFFVTIIPMLHGTRSLVKTYVCLWKLGVNPPKEGLHPRITLRKFDVLILPHYDGIIDTLKQDLNVEDIPSYPRTLFHPAVKKDGE